MATYDILNPSQQSFLVGSFRGEGRRARVATTGTASRRNQSLGDTHLDENWYGPPICCKAFKVGFETGF